VRFTTTQPTQALGMLNSDFLNEQARVFADDVRREAGSDSAALVACALRRALQRQPARGEIERGVSYLTRMRTAHALAPEDALRAFCLLVLNLNEFVYVD
jgi:hypothetical protein